MSNVLIGIIGVILFIGLALAGALFLGPRFSDSRSTSVGAATVQAVTQVGSAIVLSNTEKSDAVQAGVSTGSLTAGNYLRAVPANPSGGEELEILGGLGEATGVDAGLIVAKLPDGSGASVCSAIVKQTVNADDRVGIEGYPVVDAPSDFPRAPTGCFRMGSGNLNALEADGFYAFARI